MYSLYQEGNWMMMMRSSAFWTAHIQFTKTSIGIEWEDEENCSYAMHATKAFIWNVYREQEQ
jgi:hypothetical protein